MVLSRCQDSTICAPHHGPFIDRNIASLLAMACSSLSRRTVLRSGLLPSGKIGNGLEQDDQKPGHDQQGQIEPLPANQPDGAAAGEGGENGNPEMSEGDVKFGADNEQSSASAGIAITDSTMSRMFMCDCIACSARNSRSMRRRRPGLMEGTDVLVIGVFLKSVQRNRSC